MNILMISTGVVGALHALAPDHWLPFVMLGKAQNWSLRRLTTITILAGIGHVGSSLLISSVGILLGVALEQVNLWESARGNVASLLLIGFGIAYMVWGWKNLKKKHLPVVEPAKVVSYWTLFALIIFGPCEPLIPLVFAAYASGGMAVLFVFLVFAFATVAMMLVQVHFAYLGISSLRVHWLERGSDVIAGGAIALTGIVIRLLGI